jgi:hypothetical protein
MLWQRMHQPGRMEIRYLLLHLERSQTRFSLKNRAHVLVS